MLEMSDTTSNILEDQAIKLWQVTYQYSNGSVPEVTLHHSIPKTISNVIGSILAFQPDRSDEAVIDNVKELLEKNLPTQTRIITISLLGFTITITPCQLDSSSQLVKLLAQFLDLTIRDQIKLPKSEQLKIQDQIIELFTTRS